MGLKTFLYIQENVKRINDQNEIRNEKRKTEWKIYLWRGVVSRIWCKNVLIHLLRYVAMRKKPVFYVRNGKKEKRRSSSTSFSSLKR